MTIDTDKQTITRDTRDGLVEDNAPLGSADKNLFCPGQIANSDRFKENYDKIKWNTPSLTQQK